MNRDSMVQRLIEDDIATIGHDFEVGDFDYLHNILLHGMGYDKQTLREIIDEYNTRTWENE
jgi:hypothetical protein